VASSEPSARTRGERRRRRRIVIVCVVIAAPLLLVGASFAAARATESNSFCGTQCHEMLPYDATWTASQHHQVDCVTCHIPPGAWNFAKTKFFALREVWVHATGQVKAPIAVTRHIQNQICEGCHPQSDLAPTIQLKTATFWHPSHGQVPLCIDCHSQVVHEPIPGQQSIPPRSMNACFACHDGKTQPNACVYCHSAAHPDRGACQDCHSLDSWASDFKHPVPLEGPHQTTPCEKCHTQATSTDIGFPAGCIQCHKPPHALTVGSLDLHECAKCHVITHWYPVNNFDHPSSGCVKCHGNHHKDPAAAECQMCHNQRTWLGATHPNGNCTQCHQPGKMHSGLTDCATCHVPGVSWKAHFPHPSFPSDMVSGCIDCHPVTYSQAPYGCSHTAPQCHEGG
jgi:nitrate/TMAO reductase-like tetraheme cytochrome c subunit